jgi:hypothetical protein
MPCQSLRTALISLDFAISSFLSLDSPAGTSPRGGP